MGRLAAVGLLIVTWLYGAGPAVLEPLGWVSYSLTEVDVHSGRLRRRDCVGPVTFRSQLRETWISKHATPIGNRPLWRPVSKREHLGLETHSNCFLLGGVSARLDWMETAERFAAIDENAAGMIADRVCEALGRGDADAACEFLGEILSKSIELSRAGTPRLGVEQLPPWKPGS